MPEAGIALSTERLVLRPYRFEDLDDLLAYSQDERWSRFLPVPQPYTRGDGERWIAECVLADWVRQPRWAIEYEGRCAGGTGLTIDQVHARAEIGYSIAPRLWGLGMVVEAATAVIDWAFGSRNLARVCATADAENRQSWRVMEKLGMQREGYLRWHRIHMGEQRDVVYYGILRSEWEARRDDEGPH